MPQRHWRRLQKAMLANGPCGRAIGRKYQTGLPLETQAAARAVCRGVASAGQRPSRRRANRLRAGHWHRMLELKLAQPAACGESSGGSSLGTQAEVDAAQPCTRGELPQARHGIPVPSGKAFRWARSNAFAPNSRPLPAGKPAAGRRRMRRARTRRQEVCQVLAWKSDSRPRSFQGEVRGAQEQRELMGSGCGFFSREIDRLGAVWARRPRRTSVLWWRKSRANDIERVSEYPIGEA